MKVCIVSEGCYPYVVGGVSGWINSIIQSFPEREFVLVNILSDRTQRGKFVYELPSQVTEVHEVYLQDEDWDHRKSRLKLREAERKALRSLMLNRQVEWDALFNLFHKKKFSLDKLLMGEDFLRIAVEVYEERYAQIMFSDFLWTLRSMYLPLFHVLRLEVPRADLYHCVATGYAGVVGSMGVHFHGGRMVVSEHGIYTREREAELIRATWLDGLFKNIWIEQFKKMSTLAYGRASVVVSLYNQAREFQLELGCPGEKACVVPNGIDTKRLEGLPSEKAAGEEDMVYVGAILRVTPIKDVKTLLRAFAQAKETVPRLKLWILGPMEEESEYSKECVSLTEALELRDVVFTDSVNIRDYLGKMDFTILTSISEGQPLTVLESYAAKKPVIATDVGNCRGLIYGESDDFGQAGILTHVMNEQEIAAAIVELALRPELRRTMGERGFQRVKARHELDGMRRAYGEIYERLSGKQAEEAENASAIKSVR